VSEGSARSYADRAEARNPCAVDKVHATTAVHDFT
jgi:hypothetical protein